MKTKAVLFDMDGLMFDTERLADKVWLEVSARRGLPLREEHMTLLRGRNRDGGKVAILEHFGDDFPFDACCDEVEEEMKRQLQAEVPLRPGLFALLEALRKQGIPAAVASSTHRELVESNLRAAGVREFIAALATGDEVAHSKPAPDIFLLAAQRLGANPADCMVLEDSYNGVRAGAAAGCRTIMVPDTEPPTPEMERLADAIVTSLADVIALL